MTPHSILCHLWSDIYPPTHISLHFLLIILLHIITSPYHYQSVQALLVFLLIVL